MAGNPLLGATPAVPLVGVTQNPSTVQNNDMTPGVIALGRNGQLLVDALHGRFYGAASRGNLFMSATAIAGVTVPVPATTLASKAGIVNPLGSGRNVELVAMSVSSVTIEVAVKQFALEFQLNASSTGGSPTSVTKLTAYSMPLSTGAAVAQGYAYTAATMTNAAANPLVVPLFGNYATAVGFMPTWFTFDGNVVMGPDTVMCVTNTAAIAAVNFTYIWAEWLP